MDIWKPIKSVDAGYEVNQDGVVRSTRHNPPKVLAQRVDSRGRPVVSLRVNKIKKRCRVHRLVLESFTETPPPGMFVCHKDDDPMNNSLQNLYWGTPKENSLDAIRNGRTARGERSGSAQLSTESVLEIYARRKSGESYVDISKDYPVSSSTIGKICRGEKWSHLWKENFCS